MDMALEQVWAVSLVLWSQLDQVLDMAKVRVLDMVMDMVLELELVEFRVL
jgi:hypothetical protein